MDKDWETFLKRIWYDPGHPASFQGASKLTRELRKRKHFQNVRREDVEQWLQNQRSFSLNKTVRKTFPRARVIVSGLFDQFDADLLYLGQLRESNDGVQHVFVVIDVFSRRAWAEPLKTKEQSHMIQAFKSILRKCKNKPKRIRSDRGSEFTNQAVQTFLRKSGIHQFFTNNEKQANYAERFIKTLKSKIFRYLAAHNTERYIDVLDKIVKSYNHTFHSSIRMTPVEVNKSNERSLWWDLYSPKRSFTKRRKTVPFKYSVGNLVRASSVRDKLAREYGQDKWTKEIFKIISRFRNNRNYPMYRLADLKGERIIGTWYEYELQKITLPMDQIFSNTSLLKTRKIKGKTEHLMRYRDFPKKFDFWTFTKPDK